MKLKPDMFVLRTVALESCKLRLAVGTASDQVVAIRAFQVRNQVSVRITVRIGLV